jgi:hypothetical protein
VSVAATVVAATIIRPQTSSGTSTRRARRRGVLRAALVPVFVGCTSVHPEETGPIPSAFRALS